VVGLAHDLHSLLALEEFLDSLNQDQMIVYHHYSDHDRLFCLCQRCGASSGTSISMVVPSRGTDRMRHTPPIELARSLMPRRPRPRFGRPRRVAATSKPTPSSAMTHSNAWSFQS